MAMTEEQKDKAHEILRRFKTNDLPPDNFTWDYIAEQVGVNRTTLYRNEDIKELYAQVKVIVRKHKAKARGLDHERIEEGRLEHEIQKLKDKVKGLEAELARERERIVYATHVAQNSDIDPLAFLDSHPLSPTVVKKYSND